MSASAPCVFIVDDDQIQLLFLGRILRTAGHPVEAFSKPETLLARLSPDDRGCVVLDLQMPGLDGLGLQRALLGSGVALPLVFVSGSADVPQAMVAMRQGAADFLTKPVAPSEFIAVVERALHKDALQTAERTARERAQALWNTLTPREVEVCRCTAKGLLTKQVAAELDTSQTTVQAHRTRALKKLGVESVVELVHLLRQVGEDA